MTLLLCRASLCVRNKAEPFVFFLYFPFLFPCRAFIGLISHILGDGAGTECPRQHYYVCLLQKTQFVLMCVSALQVLLQTKRLCEILCASFLFKWLQLTAALILCPHIQALSSQQSLLWEVVDEIAALLTIVRQATSWIENISYYLGCHLKEVQLGIINISEIYCVSVVLWYSRTTV